MKKLNRFRKWTWVWLVVSHLFIHPAHALWKIKPGTDVSPQQVMLGATTWQASPSVHVTTGEYDVSWWKQFNDPQLDRLISDAIQNNTSLQAAMARLKQARAQEFAATGRLLPALNAGAGYSRQRFSDNGLNPISRFSNQSFPTPPGGRPFDIGITNPTNDYRVGFDASWELDLFGRRRWEIQQAKAQTAAAIEHQRDVQVSLIAEVARHYLELRRAQAQLRIARQNLAIQQQLSDLTRRKFAIGLAPQPDVTQTLSQIASTQATIAPLESAIKLSAHQLGLLTAKEPAYYLSALAEDKPLPSPANVSPIGQPASLLMMRPDIRRAEQELSAAIAGAGSARAQLYPTLSLTASFGLESLSISDLYKWSSRNWIINPVINQRVFQRRELKGNLRAAQARVDEQAAMARETVLNAWKEVNDAIAAVDAARRQQASLQQAVDQAEQVVNQQNQLYNLGLRTILNVLDAQRTLLTLQNQLTQSQADTSLSTIRLYKALGGGWQVL